MKLEITVKAYDYNLREHDTVIAAETNAFGHQVLSARLDMDNTGMRPSAMSCHAIVALKTLVTELEHQFNQH
jgi:hypothetical protein